MYILDLLVFLRSRIHAETTKLLLSAVSSIDAQTRTPHPHLHTHSGCMSLSSKYGWLDGVGGGSQQLNTTLTLCLLMFPP